MQSDSPLIKVYFIDEFQRSDIGRKVRQDRTWQCRFPTNVGAGSPTISISNRQSIKPALPTTNPHIPRIRLINMWVVQSGRGGFSRWLVSGNYCWLTRPYIPGILPVSQLKGRVVEMVGLGNYCWLTRPYIPGILPVSQRLKNYILSNT
jgi:hypothetical protein